MSEHEPVSSADVVHQPTAITVPTLTPIVRSSNVRALGYEAGILYVQYASGEVYRYANVTEDLFDEIRSADSIGRMLRSAVITQPARFPCQRMPKPQPSESRP